MKKLLSAYEIGAFIIISLFLVNCTQKTGVSNEPVFGDSLYLANVPPQPGEETWKFIAELQSPLWTKHDWQPSQPDDSQADLSDGIALKKNFPDPEGLLETAWEDLEKFLAAGGVKSAEGNYIIESTTAHELEGEAFRLKITKEGCKILAGGIEGIRRGIFTLEDEMLKAKGPFLPLITIEKKPVVIRRISRCVYGPIKRPPAFRDELTDDTDYYHDNYLNRLAHEGVNGLWLSVDFRDLVSTKYTPDAGKDAPRRLSKLKQTVDKCLRYGIKTYVFTIEPRAWGNQPPYYQDIHVLDNYPELGGVKRGNTQYFCPMSETARQYLYDAVNNLFSAVPGLGGMINISHGERATTCASAKAAAGGGQIDCPRCAGKEVWEILYTSLSAMEKGMHDAAPDAELISWLYMGSDREYPDWVYDIAANTPKNVILQLQFETGVTKTVFGKNLVGGDYWLATPGPSDRFIKQARIARANNTRVSAKIQTGNSHEVASIPFVPAPSLVYKKFNAMHQLGVSHTMLGWYFGNYPGLMIRSAGNLSFDPFPGSENEFLQNLAKIYWKKEDTESVVKAWKYFSEGYGNYPLQAMMGYYGPMHDGPVWPLLLKPANAPLSPTWQIGSSSTLKPWPPSGDRIGECLWTGGDRHGESMKDVLTLSETVKLCEAMSKTWDKGVEIMEMLEPKYNNDPGRLLDIGLAKALGIQFRSGYNILQFYMLREEMIKMTGKERLDILEKLTGIIREEIEMDKELLELCQKDSRLGFHSEAEGYKYFPEKIQWRMEQLKNALKNDVPEIKQLILKDKLLFPEYSGREPAGPVITAVVLKNPLPKEDNSEIPGNLDWQQFIYGKGNTSLQWAAASYEQNLLIIVSGPAESKGQTPGNSISNITVRIEPRRLWPVARYSFEPGKEITDINNVRTYEKSDKLYTIVSIPVNTFWWEDEETHPLRVDVRVTKRGEGTYSWQPSNPVTSRLVFGSDNPEDLGWMLFN